MKNLKTEKCLNNTHYLTIYLFYMNVKKLLCRVTYLELSILERNNNISSDKRLMYK